MARDLSSFTGSQPKTDYTKAVAIRLDRNIFNYLRSFYTAEG
jgi:hypothetical protein